MKIVYLYQYFHTPQMVGTSRSYEMARRLVAAGHEVHMITTLQEPTDQRSWFVTEESGIKVHWLPNPYSNHMSYRQRIMSFLKFAYRSSRRAASLDADVVFASSTPLTIALPGVYASKRRRVPLVFEVRDLWPELPVAIQAIRNPALVWLAKQLELFAYRNSRRIIALSPGMRDGIVGTGYPAERVHVIPNSADLEMFDVPPDAGFAFRRNLPWLQDRPLVVYAGTLGRINGVGYLVDVAKHALETAPEVRFLIVGDGMERDEIRERARQAGVLERNLFMLDSLPKQDVPPLLSAADVCLSLFIDLPPMWSNSANKFFDGLAAGRPIAINYGGWQAELLAEHGAGIRIHATDAKAAADQLVGYLRSPEIVTAGKRARQLAEEQFARDDLAVQLESVLQRAVGEHRQDKGESAPLHDAPRAHENRSSSP